jgi:hypothetical protein
MLKAQQQQREKWIEVVEEYERSGLTQAEFVARRGVALSTCTRPEFDVVVAA